MLKQVTNFLFAFCWLFVGLTSAYDLYLMVSLRDVLQEQNPMGQWLISINGGDVSLFAALKMGGTVIALGVLNLIFLTCNKVGLVIAVVLSLLQGLLVTYQLLF